MRACEYAPCRVDGASASAETHLRPPRRVPSASAPSPPSAPARHGRPRCCDENGAPISMTNDDTHPNGICFHARCINYGIQLSLLNDNCEQFCKYLETPEMFILNTSEVHIKCLKLNEGKRMPPSPTPWLCQCSLMVSK